MATTDRKTLKLVFGLEATDKTTTLSLLDPKTGLTMSEVTTAADYLVGKEAIVVGGAAIEDLKDAYIEEYKRIELD